MYPPTPPLVSRRVKSHSLLVVTVANHLTFCSNCCPGNHRIQLPSTQSYACDRYFTYLFISFIYLFILKAFAHTTEAHTHTHTLTHMGVRQQISTFCSACKRCKCDAFSLTTVTNSRNHCNNSHDLHGAPLAFCSPHLLLCHVSYATAGPDKDQRIMRSAVITQ